MPVVRISILRGKSPEYLKKVSSAIYDAMVEAYDLAPNDLFQMFSQHEPHEFYFDRMYGGGPRSDDFMLLDITGGSDRSIAKKQGFFKHLVDTLQERAQVRPEDVAVMLNNYSMSDISFGSGKPIVPVVAVAD